MSINKGHTPLPLGGGFLWLCDSTYRFPCHLRQRDGVLMPLGTLADWLPCRCYSLRGVAVLEA
jgi:hypothetical protein